LNIQFNHTAALISIPLYTQIKPISCLLGFYVLCRRWQSGFYWLAYVEGYVTTTVTASPCIFCKRAESISFTYSQHLVLWLFKDSSTAWYFCYWFL